MERPKLKHLDNHVVPWWAPKWRHLGKELGVGDHLMNIIECNFPSDCEACCSKMLTEWLSITPFASWEDLINAVDNLSFDTHITSLTTAVDDFLSDGMYYTRLDPSLLDSIAVCKQWMHWSHIMYDNVAVF